MFAASSSSHTSGINSAYQSWKDQLENNPEKARMQLRSKEPAEAVAIIKALAREIKHGGDKELGFKALPIISNADSKHLSKQKEKLFLVMKKRNFFRNNDGKNRELFNAALQRKDEKLINWLLRTVIDLYQRDEKGSNVIHEICERGTPEMICDAVKICLKSHKKPENRNKENPLMALSSRNSALLQNKGLIDKKITPLQILPYRNDVYQIVVAIKKYGLEKVVFSCINACRSVEDDLVMCERFCWYREGNKIPLYEVFALAALDPENEELQFTKEKLNNNLYLSCENNHHVVIDMILESLFSKHNTLSKKGLIFFKECLDWAKTEKYFALFATLLTHDRFIVCTNFPSPPLKMIYEVLQACAKSKNLDLIKKILNHLTHKEVIDSDGNSAIIHAVQSQSARFLELACEKKEQLLHLNKPNNNDETPLSIALKEKFTEGVVRLIRLNARPTKEGDWENILDFLLEKKKFFVFQYILVLCSPHPCRPLKKVHLLFEYVNAADSSCKDFLNIAIVFFNSLNYKEYNKIYFQDVDFTSKLPDLLKLLIVNHKFELADHLSSKIINAETMTEYFFVFLCELILSGNMEGADYTLTMLKKIHKRSARVVLSSLLANFVGHRDVVEFFYRKGVKLNQDQLRVVMEREPSTLDTDALYFLMCKHPRSFKNFKKCYKKFFLKALSAKPIHMRMIEALLDYGFIPTLNKKQAKILLFRLVDNNELELLIRLLSLPKVFPKEKRRLVNRALCTACSGHNSEIVRVLLAHGSRLTGLTEGNRTFSARLLRIAILNCTFERLKIIQALCERGIDLNRSLKIEVADGTIKEFSPLMYEAIYGSVEGLELLFEHGAVLNQENESSEVTIYERALTFPKYDNAFYLKAKGADTQLQLVDIPPNTRVTIASAIGSKDLLTDALSNGGVLRVEDYENNTPLHLAAKYGRLELVKFILHKEPSLLNCTNLRGETPLHLATLRRETDTVDFLVMNGANTRLIDNSGHHYIQHIMNWEFIVNPELLNEPGVPPISIPKAPKRATLRPLFEIAERMSRKDGGQYEQRIQDLSNRINTREQLTGVPTDPEDKNVWYEKFENNLRYLGYRLTFIPPGKKEPFFTLEHQENVVRDLAYASESCGTAWMTETINQLELLINAKAHMKSASADIRIYTLLQSYKKWVMSEMQMRYELLPEQLEMGMGQHIQMYLDKYLSPLLGFKGIDKRIKDPLEPTVLLQKNLLNDFLEFYTYSHIHAWLKKEIHARMKPEEIYALFGQFFMNLVDNHTEIVAKSVNIELSTLEKMLNEDCDWINKYLFRPRSEKYVITDSGITLLLLATRVIQPPSARQTYK